MTIRPMKMTMTIRPMKTTMIHPMKTTMIRPPMKMMILPLMKMMIPQRRMRLSESLKIPSLVVTSEPVSSSFRDPTVAAAAQEEHRLPPPAMEPTAVTLDRELDELPLQFPPHNHVTSHLSL